MKEIGAVYEIETWNPMREFGYRWAVQLPKGGTAYCATKRQANERAAKEQETAPATPTKE